MRCHFVMQSKVDQRNKDLRDIVDRACEKESASRSQHNLRPLHVLDLKKAPLKRINLTEEFVLAQGPDPQSESPIVTERCAPSQSAHNLVNQVAGKNGVKSNGSSHKSR